MSTTQSEISENELRFLSMHACGLAALDIAVAMGMTEYTVNLYLKAASDKLKAKHLVHAVAVATALDLINREMILSSVEKKMPW